MIRWVLCTGQPDATSLNHGFLRGRHEHVGHINELVAEPNVVEDTLVVRSVVGKQRLLSQGMRHGGLDIQAVADLVQLG